jgi:dTMP kinase
MWICFEGCDGSGKSALLKETAKRLKERGMDVLCTREPGSPMVDVCKAIRQVVLDPNKKIEPNSEFLLFMVDRIEHYRQVIEPNQSKLILQDRCYLSTEVYNIHTAMNGKLPDEFVSIHRAVAEIPDGFIFLNTPFELCVKRIELKKEKVDKDWLKRIHRYYQKEFRKKHQTEVIMIDGSRPVELNAKMVIDFIEGVKEVRVR